MESSRQRIAEGIAEAHRRLAELDHRTDLTERGRKQQRTLWANRVRQLEGRLVSVNRQLAQGSAREKD